MASDQSTHQMRLDASAHRAPREMPVAVDVGALAAPITFWDGPFAGRTIRAVGTEIQKADRGRKYARKDKRPLDPPPVAEVRFFEVFHAGTPRQYERELLITDELLLLGLVCHVDLFAIGGEVSGDGNTQNDTKVTDMHHGKPVSRLALPSRVPATSLDAGLLHPTAEPIAYYNSQPIKQSDNVTHILAGARCSPAMTLEYKGRDRVVFAFNDLAVKKEGIYCLRYRIINLFATVSHDGGLTKSIPVLGSCFGGTFQVWSTKTFPGLAPSTELTRRLSLLGTAVNVRSAEGGGKGRKRRKPTDGRDSSHGPEPDRRYSQSDPGYGTAGSGHSSDSRARQAGTTSPVPPAAPCQFGHISSAFR